MDDFLSLCEVGALTSLSLSIEFFFFIFYGYVVGESPYRQGDSLLVSRLLRPRQKFLNMDTDFLLDSIRLMNEREGER
jgi:hypothetical protein